MKRSNLITVFFVVLSLVLANVQAEDITIGLTAEVRLVDDPHGMLSGHVNVGDSLTGMYTYDSCTPDSNPDVTVGDYQHSNAPYGIFLTVGGLDFQTDPTNVDFLVEILNRARDNYLLRSYNNLPADRRVHFDDVSRVIKIPELPVFNID